MALPINIEDLLKKRRVEDSEYAAVEGKDESLQGKEREEAPLRL